MHMSDIYDLWIHVTNVLAKSDVTVDLKGNSLFSLPQKSQIVQ